MSSKKRNTTKPQIEFLIDYKLVVSTSDKLAPQPEPYDTDTVYVVTRDNSEWAVLDIAIARIFPDITLPYDKFALKVLHPTQVANLYFDNGIIRMVRGVMHDGKLIDEITAIDNIVIENNKVYIRLDGRHVSDIFYHIDIAISVLHDLLLTLYSLSNSNIEYTTRSSSKAIKNNGKGKKRIPIIQHTAVRLKDSYIRPKPVSTGEGSPKSPHLRRSHIRTLKNGTTCVVKSCKIKGGTDKANYSVTSM